MGRVRASSSEPFSIPIHRLRFASTAIFRPKLEDVMNKALEKDRNLRYQSAADMRTDLQRLKRDTETGRVRAVSSGGVAADQESEERVYSH